MRDMGFRKKNRSHPSGDREVVTSALGAQGSKTGRVTVPSINLGVELWEATRKRLKKPVCVTQNDILHTSSPYCSAVYLEIQTCIVTAYENNPSPVTILLLKTIFF